MYFLLKFTIPVKMDSIQRDFGKMFTHYGQLSDFKKRPVKQELESLEAINFSKDDQSVQLRIKFKDPNQFGLLIRKNDTLIFETVSDYPYLSVF